MHNGGPLRPTESGHMLYCYFCRNCGTRMLHMASGKNVVSVKGGCIEGLDWSGAIHIWTKSAMVPIPEGCESYSREPWDSGHSTSQDSLDQSPRNRTLDASHGSGDDGFRELAGSGGFESAGEEEMGKGGQDGAAAPTCGRIKGGCEFSMV
ncbi:hypothetical protein GGS23DRAFT_351695 [Durotheca rogersii]|uniref:uncharacterized protein n=1 Tax=Durotheca rogersii TaxID=419775 RepID=UPI00221F0B57|nr:uncharacterized protein GGS23DRAFT_351695 [Durotheca rogersii]KAI5865712.1 hypothetical protein GGS23DRAFT_351695 [Durotheca rogersii]